MSALRDWMLSLTAGALALSLMRALMPRDAAGKVGELAIGLVMVVLLLRPLTNLSPDWLVDSLEAQLTSAQAYPEELQAANDSYLESVMSRRCEEYIVSQGAALGLTVDATVECLWRSGCPIPARVILTGESSDELERIIMEELGVEQTAILIREVEE